MMTQRTGFGRTLLESRFVSRRAGGLTGGRMVIGGFAKAYGSRTQDFGFFTGM